MDAPVARIWSVQQRAFIDWCINGIGSCVLEALAGTGKTSVLIEAAQRMFGQVAIVAYGKDISDELKKKLKELGIDWKKVQAGTVHSFGFGAIRKVRPAVKVDNFKVANIIENLLNPRGDQYCDHPLWFYRSETAKLISIAKQAAIGVIGVDDEHVWRELADRFDVFDDADENPPPVTQVIAFARKVLGLSNQNMDIVDFGDMVYLPLVHKLSFWQFAVIMVDEAQDTNAARRALVRAMLKKGGRVIAVGDKNQAIFGFTGADSDALNLIAKDFNCIRMPLTVSFRCSKAVIKFAQQWVPEIEPAPSAPEGDYKVITFDDFLVRNDLNGEAAVLCRVNAPLVSLAFKLIRKRVPCRVLGREIGNGLIKLITRWKITTLDQLEKKLDTYLDRQRTKLLAAKKEAKLVEIEDQVETVRVVIDQCRMEKKYTLDDAVAYVDGMFTDNVTNMLVLSSIHKSKGKEWQRVFWLDRANTCPSKWARQLWQQEQEKNLLYTAATRAKEGLTEILVDKPITR